MLIRDQHWGMIRHRFSEEEKIELRNAVVGQAICPKAQIIDDSSLKPELLEKLNNALGKKSPTGKS